MARIKTIMLFMEPPICKFRTEEYWDCARFYTALAHAGNSRVGSVML